ncbi:GDP-mannose mannosyl hydrolase [Glaciecola sp. 1036]|uniref:GDP-mannose mannosyl hydrolase n=1 Tax=Alteromonadaceae TaxID=72275 RepID=UPI003D032766
MKYLNEQTFKTVVDSTPLVSIDLVVKNSKRQALLGYRTNRPAQNYWFVPGGRVLKNETLDSAFLRLTKAELGISCRREQAEFLGVYEHFYDDSALDEQISTHYVVLGYVLHLDVELSSLPNEQHNQYRWFYDEEIMKSDNIHRHTKWYFE